MRSITLPTGWPAFPRVYEPFLFGDRPRFYVSAPAELVEDIQGVRERDGRVVIQSRARPEVYAADLDWLVQELDRYDARNLSRDRLLADHQLRVWFEPIPYHKVPYVGSGTSLQLKKVEIL